MIALPLPPPRATHASSPSFRDRLRSHGPYAINVPTAKILWTQNRGWLTYQVNSDQCLNTDISIADCVP